MSLKPLGYIDLIRYKNFFKDIKNFSVKSLYVDKICCYGTAEQKTSHILGQQLIIVYIYFHIYIKPLEPHIIKIITQI